MSTRRSRGIERYVIRCLLGSVRTRRRESARRAFVRPGVVLPSVPMTRVVAGVVRSEPSSVASRLYARRGRRLFALSTPFENDTKPRIPQTTVRRKRPATPTSAQTHHRRRRFGVGGVVGGAVARRGRSSGTLPLARPPR